ncbi:MAG: hypothetical protein RL076_2387 [Chloroflexota bacterium]|jgi:multiple sugar transport system permease protein/sn-glycerol 3-phosphate transport system permease protein
MTKRRIRNSTETMTFLALVSVNVLLISAFTFYPLWQGIQLSFYQWDFISAFKIWVGLKNYIRLWNDPTFWQILRNTVIFTVCTVSFTITIAFVLALTLSLPLRGRELVRGVIFLPTLLSGAAIALVFNYILDDRFGLVQQGLRLVGGQSPSFYTNPFWAMVGVITTMVWKNAGYAAVILIAGLQSIDHTLYEAAAIDGAGRRARLWHVTLPSLAPMLLFTVVTGILGTFQSFDIIRVMTNGGPVNATNVLVYHLYERGFVNFEAGPAGAITVVIFVIMLVLTVLQLQVGKHTNAHE